jgi:hypothetical protein
MLKTGVKNILYKFINTKNFPLDKLKFVLCINVWLISLNRLINPLSTSTLSIDK